MSVKKSERNESKLSVILKAESITVYTIEITGNEKYFPKRHRWSLTVRLVDATLDMLQYVVTANSIRVKDAASKNERYQLQERAYATSAWLLTLINIAFMKFKLATDRVEYWTGQVVEFQRQLRAWQKSDEVRYAEF